MQISKFQYRRSSISCRRFGSGLRKVICFHGYGEESSSFVFLESYASAQFSFYAIDLPFHGDTDWKEGLNFEIRDLLEIVQGIAGPGSAEDPYILIGFSLGGRVALSLYQVIPQQIERLILLAPDGLRMNGWYWLSTQTWWGNKLFSITSRSHPGWFLGLLKILRKLRLANASVYKFVNSYFSDKPARDQLYLRWTSLRKLRPNLKMIRQSIKKYGAKVRLVYGNFDRIILSPVGEKFRKNIEKECKIIKLDAGHRVLNERYAKEIMFLLNDENDND